MGRERSVRRPTATSSFGVSRREGHDASAFYARFSPPALSDDTTIAPHAARNMIWSGDARAMDTYGTINDSSVALVVTSPPYFAGKEYEAALGEGHIPGSYRDYLEMLQAVFAECVRKLEPGGRIAVNVANLGRKPYRSLSADVIAILEDLRLLLRGEIIWRKQLAASGSCAWGTFQRPGNPVLRDLTERVVVASKGRFDRAVPAAARRAAELANEGSIAMDEFIDATLDVWDIPAESATRVGHPAPFPVELPRRLIELYTYRGDLVLDPFMGAGSTAVAAVQTERFYVGFDTDASYIELAERRVAAATPEDRGRVVVPPGRSTGSGQKAAVVARELVEKAGFDAVEEKVALGDVGVDVSMRARDTGGRVWLFEVVGGFSTTRPGLKRLDVVWRTLGKASAVEVARRTRPARGDAGPLVVLTTDLPVPSSAGAKALSAMVGPGRPVRAVIDLLDDSAVTALTALATPCVRADAE
jgi:site-specific DNA-methyltransferase (adenine-specific)